MIRSVQGNGFVVVVVLTQLPPDKRLLKQNWGVGAGVAGMNRSGG